MNGEAKKTSVLLEEFFTIWHTKVILTNSLEPISKALENGQLILIKQAISYNIQTQYKRRHQKVAP